MEFDNTGPGLEPVIQPEFKIDLILLPAFFYFIFGAGKWCRSVGRRGWGDGGLKWELSQLTRSMWFHSPFLYDGQASFHLRNQFNVP